MVAIVQFLRLRFAAMNLPEPSLAQKLAETVWKGDLRAYVREARSEGRAWRTISREVWDKSKGVIDVSDQTLRKWYPDPAGTAAGEPEPNGDTRVA